MRSLITLATLSLLLALTGLAQPARVGAEANKAFKDGWNTWAEAKKGDWAIYKTKSGITKRYEVVDVSNDQITVKTLMTPPGKDAKPIETLGSPTDWSSIPLMGSRVPETATWTTVEQTVNETKFDCDQAEWNAEDLQIRMFYSKTIPCGGYVKCTHNGESMQWLDSWGHNAAPDKPDAKPGDDPKAQVDSNTLNWQFRTKGNTWTLKMAYTKPAALEVYAKYEVTEVAADHAVYTLTKFDKNMLALNTQKDLQQRFDDKASPTPAGATEEELDLKVLGKLKCTKVVSEAGGVKSTNWTYKGLTVKTIYAGIDVAYTAELSDTNLKP